MNFRVVGTKLEAFVVGKYSTRWSKTVDSMSWNVGAAVVQVRFEEDTAVLLIPFHHVTLLFTMKSE